VLRFRLMVKRGHRCYGHPDAKSLAAAVASAAVMAPDAPSYRYAAERQVVGKLVMSAEVMQQVAAMLFQDMPTRRSMSRAAWPHTDGSFRNRQRLATPAAEAVTRKGAGSGPRSRFVFVPSAN
jgi:alkylhydroperoxidase family enzyme